SVGKIIGPEHIFKIPDILLNISCLLRMDFIRFGVPVLKPGLLLCTVDRRVSRHPVTTHLTRRWSKLVYPEQITSGQFITGDVLRFELVDIYPVFIAF